MLHPLSFRNSYFFWIELIHVILEILQKSNANRHNAMCNHQINCWLTLARQCWSMLPYFYSLRSLKDKIYFIFFWKTYIYIYIYGLDCRNSAKIECKSAHGHVQSSNQLVDYAREAMLVNATLLLFPKISEGQNILYFFLKTYICIYIWIGLS